MENVITKPAITRLARRAGIRTISQQCFGIVRTKMDSKLQEIVRSLMIVNSEKQHKTIMISDIYEALHLLNYNIAQSSCLEKRTYIK